MTSPQIYDRSAAGTTNPGTKTPADTVPTRNQLDYMTLPPTTNWVLPVSGMQSKPGDKAQGGNWSEGSFGYQKPISKGGHIHEGVDIYADAGTAILAPVSGTITSVGQSSEGGNYVRMRGTDGIDYYFAHMGKPSPWSQGTKVRAGIYIGDVGQTGNAAGTSPHLHFSMRKNGRAVKPNDFLRTGQQQKVTPLSAIPGLNTPEEIQAWANQELARQQEAQNVMNAGGMDVAGIPGMIAGAQAEVDDQAWGQKFLGSTLGAMSRRVSGGERIPIPTAAAVPEMSSALDDATSGPDVSLVGTTEGVATEEAVHPVLQRQEVEPNG